MGQPSPPSPPDPNQTFAAGIRTQLQYLPKELRAEYLSRAQYDPRFIEQQLGFQEQYGPRQYADQIAAQKQLDPYGTALRAQLGQATSKDLALGTSLDPAFQQQLQSQIRGAQTARGGATMGNAPISGEALYQGRAAQQMYQQRIQNASNFLQLRTPEADMSFVPGVQAPDQFRLVNPNAGLQGQQIGQQGFQNQLAAYSLGNQGGGLGGVIGGGIGTAAGAYFGGAAGAGAGGALGSAAGSYFSDRRIKENIVDTGERTKDGIPRVTFNYIGLPKRYKGLLAQDVLIKRPECVWQNRGILGVFYDMLGEKMEAV